MPSYDDAETIRCTRCGKYILEDSERCPYCGHYQLADEHNRRPLWFILTVILCILLIGSGLIFGLLELLPWRL
ncbi:MAG: zinc-ribbon domain-containing protein [Phycisphaerales bacterium]|nr:zinc-ribbon domain-containing protein [Phycisphaerales bacterium]